MRSICTLALLWALALSAPAYAKHSPRPTEHKPQTGTISNVKLGAVEPLKPSATMACMEHPMDVVDAKLFAIYEATPKLDAHGGKEHDFTNKDQRAAEHAKMSLKDFVVGGVDPDFRRRLYCLMLGLEEAAILQPELKPGITRMYADAYRQHIAEGLKACDNCTYHGSLPSLGYGHGIATDVVGHGTTTKERELANEKLWAWIDAHYKEYGLGRPYPFRDPVHLALASGGECVHHAGCDPAQMPSHYAHRAVKKIKSVLKHFKARHHKRA
jgi:hypothetical protein